MKTCPCVSLFFICCCVVQQTRIRVNTRISTVSGWWTAPFRRGVRFIADMACTTPMDREMTVQLLGCYSYIVESSAIRFKRIP